MVGGHAIGKSILAKLNLKIGEDCSNGFELNAKKRLILKEFSAGIWTF